MPNVKNYVLLETITVGAAGASSVTFNNIPQTGYTDLKVVMSTRTTDSNAAQVVDVRLNNSSTNISVRMLYGSGSSTASTTSTSNAIWTTANSATANTFGNAEIYFPNYTSSSNKSWSADSVSENNATVAYANIFAGLWSNTAAISSITFVAGASANFAQYSTFSLYGLAAVGTTPTVAPYAAGGDIIQTDGTYWYHAFLSTGTFTPQRALSADILVIAGGGAGGGVNGGWGAGGGAGGLLGLTAQSLATTNYTVTVGAGGAGAAAGTQPANGSNSQFGSLTAAVGGGGAAVNGSSNGSSGGSGGGGGAAGNGGAGTSGQGFAGGNGDGGSNQGFGGGGGAGGAAGNGTSAAGVGSSSYSSWGSITGTGQNISGTYWFAGGGGGSLSSGSQPLGGSGGGGNGSSYNGGSTQNQGTAGTANTGGGGGGNVSTSAVTGKSGGSGIVIVRYLR